MGKDKARKNLLYSKLDHIENQIEETKQKISEIKKQKTKRRYIFKYIKCGKPKCHCVTGERHGPYPHLQWWDPEKGGIKTKYLNEKNYPIYKKELEKNKLKRRLERELVRLEKEKKEVKSEILRL